MHGFLKIIEQENLTGSVPEWCEGIEPEQHARWCFNAATIAMVMTVVSASASAIGAIQQGKATKASSNLQAGILQQQADRDREQAAADEADFRLQQSRVLAARRAAGGGSGITPTGSSLLVAEDFARTVDLYAQRIRSGGELRAARADWRGEFLRRQASAGESQSFIRGGSLMLAGAGKAYSEYE